MFKTGRVLLIAGVILATGCVSTENVPVTDETVSGMSDKSLAVVKRDKPDFAAMTAGKAMFGLLGAGAMISAGNRIVDENDIQDPAVEISAALARDLAAKSGVVVATNHDETAAHDGVAELSRQYSAYDYLLDVRTVDWSFIYFATDWNNYAVNYSAKLRLIDTRTRQAIAEGFCSRNPEKTDDAPSREELLADGAAKLKSELKLAAEHCIAEFGSKTLMVAGK